MHITLYAHQNQFRTQYVGYIYLPRIESLRDCATYNLPFMVVTVYGYCIGGATLLLVVGLNFLVDSIGP